MEASDSWTTFPVICLEIQFFTWHLGTGDSGTVGGSLYQHSSKKKLVITTSKLFFCLFITKDHPWKKVY